MGHLYFKQVKDKTLCAGNTEADLGITSLGFIKSKSNW